VFHCKTCSAEGRFDDGGLSETGFVSQLYGMKNSDAVLFLANYVDYNEDGSYERFMTALHNEQNKLEYLEARGITIEEVNKYKLGYNGSGIVYPVFVNGFMMDKRIYNTSPQGNEAKIKSQKNAKPLFFPFDDWYEDLDKSDFTLMTAGENDTLLARKYGYNAVESTMGEGSFPKIFAGLFQDKKVIICYDCDEAGKNAARQIAFYLKEAGATVSLMDLGLEGTKEDKDVTDFFIKHNYTKDDFDKKIAEAVPFTEEDHLEVKNKKYPLVDLWDVPEGKYSGKRLSTRAIMMGKFSTPMEVPTAIHVECINPSPDSTICASCPYFKDGNHERWWTLGEDNLKDVLELVEVNSTQQHKTIKRLLRIPTNCPNPPRYQIRERKHVTKVIFSPDVDTENELSGFKSAEQHAYVIGKNLEDGGRYRLFFKRYAHPLDKQKIVMVVDDFEQSDNSTNAFKMTPEILQELSQFQMTPEDAMKLRYELAKKVVGTFTHPMVVNCVNLTFHSPLQFKLYGKYSKTPFEVVIVGESRTGKTETAQFLEMFYGLGNFTAVKNAKTTGLLGGVDKLPSGEYRIKWGKIPLNHKGLIILDEMSGLSKETMATLTDMRSEGVAVIEKIISGKAPAKARIIWTTNTRTNAEGNTRAIDEYPNGVKIILELVGSAEDIARFDFCYIMPNDGKLIPPRFEDEEIMDNLTKLDNTPHRHLIQWVWSRNADQTKFDRGVDRYIWNVSMQLNEIYNCQYQFFGRELPKKLGKLAASVAAMCFSHDGTGEVILVKKEHVDWAVQFMKDIYDNDTFRLAEFVAGEKKLIEPTEESNIEVNKLMKKYPMFFKLLLENDECNPYGLKAATGIGDDEYKYIVSTMFQHGLLKQSKNGIQSSKKLKRSINALRTTSAPKMQFPIDVSEQKSFSDKVQLD
jgi:5S rRNA maturation endonuclease (ribonuclease M5)